jgi:hypothetical protein
LDLTNAHGFQPSSAVCRVVAQVRSLGELVLEAYPHGRATLKITGTAEIGWSD